MAAGLWYPQSTATTVFNDVEPNKEDESTSKTKQPDQICHSPLLSTAERMLTECDQRQRQ